eukprot:GHVR01143343.1.p1 GENE.GHVR01143343.1~~GHVR01143343.1.p1  ORF type:complete len:572 (+),score=161.10 GHVR01143343.1:258-1973(+)
MCTGVKKLQQTLIYLENVRQHMSRLPSIDTSTRTLLLAGYPNVGKSSFMNKVSTADVQVQDYAFTTRSLFVGHFDDSNYTRWQVIDTPGVLDRPLDERNTIEMTAVTALAHLNSCILYFIDVSGHCGWSLEQQLQLFTSLTPLFKLKPVVLILNKIDIHPLSELTLQQQQLIQDCSKNIEVFKLHPCSTLTGEGVIDIREIACGILTSIRVKGKIDTNKTDKIMNRLHVSKPRAVSGKRLPCVPDSVINSKNNKNNKNNDDIDEDTIDSDNDNDNNDDNNDDNDGSSEIKYIPNISNKTEKMLQEVNGGPGVYSVDLHKNYLLKNKDWRSDIVPEILDGRNICDFIDDDIDAKLKELEEEEELLLQDITIDNDEVEWNELSNVREALHKHIRQRRLEASLNKSRLPRTRGHSVANAVDILNKSGYDTTNIHTRAKSRGRSLTRRIDSVGGSGSNKRGRDDDNDINMSDTNTKNIKINDKREQRLPSRNRVDRSIDPIRAQSTNPHRSKSLTRFEQGVPLLQDREKVIKMKMKADKRFKTTRKKGEADRFIGTAKPKHLYSGKRGIGKTDWR